MAKMLDGAKPAKLLRKTCHVEAVRGDESSQWWDRLPVHTLTFENPGGPGSPPMDVRIDVGDVVKVVVPDYKPKSYSMSRQGDGEFDITYKFYPGGKCSGYLHGLEVGDEIQCFGKGAKTRNPGKHVGLVAFGVGITEALPVAAAELSKPEAEYVKLIWASKTWADTFWRDEIKKLKAKYPDKFEITYILSREDRAGCRKGRVDPAVLREEFGAFVVDSANARFLSVGTKGMMKEFDAMITESLGYEYPKNKLLVK